MELGIIGFGQFGQFTAAHLKEHFEVVVCDSADRSAEAADIGVGWADLKRVANCGTVVFAVPLSALDGVTKAAAPLLKPGTLCLDVCSVKIEPVRTMLETLPESVEIIGTHPLFGPQSGREGIDGMRVAVCPVRTTRTESVKKFLSDSLNLRVFEKSPEEHDREMAHVQALTHFVARALDELHVEGSELATVSYDELMRAARLVSEDSWELFRTIQQGNPYAEAKRRDFVAKLIEIENRVTAESKSSKS